MCAIAAASSLQRASNVCAATNKAPVASKSFALIIPNSAASLGCTRLNTCASATDPASSLLAAQYQGWRKSSRGCVRIPVRESCGMRRVWLRRQEAVAFGKERLHKAPFREFLHIQYWALNAALPFSSCPYAFIV